MNPYDKAMRASRKLGESNDCSVITTSVLTGVDYEKVHALYKKQGRVNRKPVLGATIEYVLGVYFGKTLSSSDGKDLSKGKYIGITEDHAFAIIDGQVFDSDVNHKRVVKYVVRVNDTSPSLTKPLHFKS